ncbi:MAG: ATP-dependent metallopeptidase FtsH/Yme1/Tma family protein [Dehalococcoidia bacterium]|nr:ATP-dependent metallopeptidase FtsH/Yme1/Tma family protein [Dehalococcoidia bacterium]
MMSSRWLRNSFIYLLILVAVTAVLFSFFQSGTGKESKPFGTVIEDAKAGRIERIKVSDDTLALTYNDGREFTSRKETGATIAELLQQAGVHTGPNGVQVEVAEPSQFGSILGLMLNFLPILIFVGIIIFMMRQAQGSNSQAMSFGKSRARMFVGNTSTVTFADVAGVDESKEELQEIVEFLKFPEKFAALGARIPRGVLLVGPPGTGKTLLSRAVAGEAGVPFFSISGSEFVEMFVGVGASRVRDLFEQAKRNAPCIVFVDEIDAVGRQRGAGLGGSHDEREQTLNQILVEMDGFGTNTNVIVIAATNRPDILDPALLRPGRFDRQVVLDRPDVRGRVAILNVHAKGKPLDADVDMDILAKQTPGFSGADLANLMNEAAILAARRNKKKVAMDEFEEAVDRVIAGPERKSRVISPREKEIIAYHEAGHALVAYTLPDADPVYKITIVSRGMAGGYTRFLPDEERHLGTKRQFEAMLASMLGGHAAEELQFDEMTTGASDDISRATKLARQMVTQWGMSEKLGPRTFGRKEELIFLGREISEQRDYSEKVAEEIDEEVRAIIDAAHQKARRSLQGNRDKLSRIARVLIEEETIEGEALKRLFQSTDDAPPPSEIGTTASAGSAPAAPTADERETPRPSSTTGLAWGGGPAQSTLEPDPGPTPA